MFKYLLIALSVIAGAFILFHPKGLLRRLNSLKPSQNNSVVINTNNPPSSNSSISSPFGIALGVYQPPSNPEKDFTNPDAWGQAIDDYSNKVGKKPAFAWRSVKWEDKDGNYVPFAYAGSFVDQFSTRGIMPGLNWDASKGSALTKGQKDFSWQTINSGKHDNYIKQWAKDAALYHYPFLMRLFAEVDGPWYPWGYNAEGQGNTDPADFVAAWKHVVDIFRKEGATNVQFVWCLAAGVLDTKMISQYGGILKNLYPGDDYVDWVALDGYSNLAATPERTLQDVFQPTYQFVRTLTQKPMIFYEVGAIENPNDNMAKANWITQGFLTTIPTIFPDVKLVNWFAGPSDPNPNKPDKQTIYWAVDTSQNSLNAWKQVVASPLYQGVLVK